MNVGEPKTTAQKGKLPRKLPNRFINYVLMSARNCKLMLVLSLIDEFLIASR
jgi:hypothetical protein